MSVTSQTRGHAIEWYNGGWHYTDTGEIADVERPCVRCGGMPTAEGHDACLGELPGVEYACCGHGVDRGYAIENGQERYLMEERKLRSLEEANGEARRGYVVDWGEARLNRIACPDCGAELMDTNPDNALASWPPQIAVHCSECGYTGSRIV